MVRVGVGIKRISLLPINLGVVSGRGMGYTENRTYVGGPSWRVPFWCGERFST